LRSFEASDHDWDRGPVERPQPVINKERTNEEICFLALRVWKAHAGNNGRLGKWFESIKDNTIDMGGHFSGGREISKDGTKDLPLGPESITGFTIVSAESLDDAEKMAQRNPYISSIRVYEVMLK
jgi:hypothetical protein